MEALMKMLVIVTFIVGAIVLSIASHTTPVFAGPLAALVG
jgi:hypothetical protein